LRPRLRKLVQSRDRKGALADISDELLFQDTFALLKILLQISRDSADMGFIWTFERGRASAERVLTVRACRIIQPR